MMGQFGFGGYPGMGGWDHGYHHGYDGFPYHHHGYGHYYHNVEDF
ncbi:hypothetical protein [Heyndrickxia vini]|nr:hypothetical protein [Heyndrickxia vini]